MKHQWNERLAEWARPPTEQEEQKGATAAEMINNALRAYSPLASYQFRVYPTGSYRNNTNVRLGSDIDIAVVLTESCYLHLPSGITREELGFHDATYGLEEFRKDVQDALKLKFGESAVTAGDITLNVCESSRRQDADVTPFVQHRRYTDRGDDGSWHFVAGAETRPHSSPSRRIINWHEQHYTEGVKRNEATSRRFKRITRILKRLRDEMQAQIPSFLIECMVYNAPESCFNLSQDGYYDDVCATLNHLWVFTSSDQACAGLVEVSRLKQLFSPEQAWTRDDAHTFLHRAYLRMGSRP